MKALLESWEEELARLKTDLEAIGDEANSLAYNVLASDALRLSMSASDAYKAILMENNEVNR